MAGGTAEAAPFPASLLAETSFSAAFQGRVPFRRSSRPPKLSFSAPLYSESAIPSKNAVVAGALAYDRVREAYRL
jgi:hypothetical protein